MFSTFHFPCLHVSFLSMLKRVLSHHQNSLSLTLYAHFHYFKKPLHSFLLLFLTLTFFPHVLFLDATWPLDIVFFSARFSFLSCSSSLCCVKHFTLPTFFHGSSNYNLHSPSSPLTFLFLSYSCFVFPLNVTFSHYFFLPVLSLYSSVSVSWTLPILTAHLFEKVHVYFWTLHFSHHFRDKGKRAYNGRLLPG